MLPCLVSHETSNTKLHLVLFVLEGVGREAGVQIIHNIIQGELIAIPQVKFRNGIRKIYVVRVQKYKITDTECDNSQLD